MNSKNIYAIKGLHHGVFSSLDYSLCPHKFWVPSWNSIEKPKPNNVHIMTKEQLEDPDDSFFDAILVQSIDDYMLVKDFDKTIMFYNLMNSRGNPANHVEVLKNPRVIPLYISTSCRTSHGIFDGKHKTIYPGIDENFWNGYTGEDRKIIHVRNAFKERDPQKFKDFEAVCEGEEYTLVGTKGNMYCGADELVKQFRKHRVFVNIEIYTSTFSISSMEAMMTGMPIICNDIESTGEAIRNGVEGFISNDMNYLKKRTRELLNDVDMAKELGNNAREMAKMKFSKKQFNMAWNDLFENMDSYRRV